METFISEIVRQDTPKRAQQKLVYCILLENVYFWSIKDFHRKSENNLTVLQNLQLETLQALVVCIIPADDTPNGWDAGVGDYLLRLLTREPRFLFEYQTQLDWVEQEFGFSRLTADAQNRVLTQWEQDPEREAFFQLLVSHVMEGFYADPGNGGNRNGLAWQMIGYKVTV